MLRPGDVAPNATVFTSPRKPAQLHDFQGKPLVLLFFPLAFSGVCTREICSVAEDWSAYEALDAQVIGLSVDSPYVNQRFAESCKAKFPIVSDFNREATQAYGVVRSDLDGLQGVSERAAFVINRAGVIVYSWVGEHPGVFPPLDEIKEAVKRA